MSENDLQKVENLKTLIETIVANLTGRIDGNGIKVICLNGDRSTVIEITAPKEDVGKVIGKSGRIANSIRILIAACASGCRVKRRISVEILD